MAEGRVSPGVRQGHWDARRYRARKRGVRTRLSEGI
jgi:hypothetical protein